MQIFVKQNMLVVWLCRLKMAISKDTPLGLAYIIVIIALILPQTAAHIVSIQESVVGNVKGFCEKSLQSLYFLPFQIFCNCQNYDTVIPEQCIEE